MMAKERELQRPEPPKTTIQESFDDFFQDFKPKDNFTGGDFEFDPPKDDPFSQGFSNLREEDFDFGEPI